MMQINGKVGELRMTLQITRKATGKVEEVELVGFLDEDELKELNDGRNSFDSSPERSD